MRAKVTKEFKGRRDHESVTRTIAVGEEIDGDLAKVAVREKWAEEIREKADKSARSETAAKADQ